MELNRTVVTGLIDKRWKILGFEIRKICSHAGQVGQVNKRHDDDATRLEAFERDPIRAARYEHVNLDLN